MTMHHIDKNYKLFIGGEWISGKGGNTFDIFCPANGELLTTCAVAEKEDVDLAVWSARAAFETWKDTSINKRSRAMFKIADLLENTETRTEIVAECRDIVEKRHLYLYRALTLLAIIGEGIFSDVPELRKG